MRRLLLLALGSCATLASPGGGAQNLPSSGVGPFQALGQMQVAAADIAPFIFTLPAQPTTEPTVLADAPDGSSPGVTMYLVAPGKTGLVVMRTHADDGLSFYGDTADVENNASHKLPVVLSASLAWEGTDVSGPSALRVGSEVWLFYAASMGIGLATSSDGRTFTKMGAPVLAVDKTVAWETTAPRAPSVAVFPDGSWHMMYAAGTSIGEATSTNGTTWKRVDGDASTPALDPVLRPSVKVDPSTLGPGEHPPFDESAVDDPLLLPRTDPTGQLQVRVLYTGYGPQPDASAPGGTIGFAARYGSTGALTRQSVPAYAAAGVSVTAPAVLQWNGPTMLYASQLDTTKATPMPEIAGAYDPAAGSPPPPAGSFPTSP